MADLPSKPRSAGLGTLTLVGALLALLVAASWFAARTWTAVEGPPMPASGYIAMTLGVGFSLLVGFALMALLFYSARHGYDEQAGEARRRSDES